MNCQTGTDPETEGLADPFPWGAQTLPVLTLLNWTRVLHRPDLPLEHESEVHPDALFQTGVPTPAAS